MFKDLIFPVWLSTFVLVSDIVFRRVPRCPTSRQGTSGYDCINSKNESIQEISVLLFPNVSFRDEGFAEFKDRSANMNCGWDCWYSRVKHAILWQLTFVLVCFCMLVAWIICTCASIPFFPPESFADSRASFFPDISFGNQGFAEIQYRAAKLDFGWAVW